MKRDVIILISIPLIALAGATCFSLDSGEVCLKKYCFRVELAKSPSERAKGLMFREYLDREEGMLFIFEEEAEHSFWMKNTLIPLDIIWINKNKEVVFIDENVQPCKADPCIKLNPGVKAKYVLELNAHTAGEVGLSVGDQLEINESNKATLP